MTRSDGGQEPILEIVDLAVGYGHKAEWLTAVRDFDLRIYPGQTYGLVGESGSGKTTVALTIMRYLQNGKVLDGRITFNGRDLLLMSNDEMRTIWGDDLALVPQDPLSSLNPSLRIGEQLSELLRHHQGLSGDEADARVQELLIMVRVPDPARVAASYPHQMSGGMQQRVIIAMALSTEPALLVLDEPTTALDVTTQAAILDLFSDLICDRGTAALYVTHNLGVVARICDRVAVLYAGDLVEDAPTSELFHRPLHPYTYGLMASVPQLGVNKAAASLQAIPGQIPALGQRPSGCVFAPRCPLAIEVCSQTRPELEAAPNGRHVACHRWREIAAGDISPAVEAVEHTRPPSTDDKGEAALELQDLTVHFALRRSLRELVTRQPARQVKAVQGVDLRLPPGKTLGLVGESGSGKTSLARAVIGLEDNSGGSMKLYGQTLPTGLKGRQEDLMRQLQIVFQNPEEALNPYHTVGETLRWPLMKLRGLSREEADAGVVDLLAAVRLPASYASRRPGQLSGGEKQRAAIARAFAAEPELLICDEPVSALDVSVQASILNLLRELQSDQTSAILFISHDLAVVSYLADEIAVIYVGHLMEVTPAEQLLAPPFHPYTEALLSAVPTNDPDRQQQRIRLEGDVPSQINLPPGCPFHPRCPRYLGEICRQEKPPWQRTDTGKRIYCHIPVAELSDQQKELFAIQE